MDPAPACPSCRMAETILFSERGSGLDADIGDLLLDGVAMVWNIVRR